MEEKGYPVKRAVVYETPNNCAAYRETEEETEAVWLELPIRVVEKFVSINGEGRRAGELCRFYPV